MSREPVVAMDFLGLGKSAGDPDSELKMEERGKLVKPMATLPTASEQGSARAPNGEGSRETSGPLLMLGTDSSHVRGPRAFSLSQAMPWASMAGKAEEMERGGGAGRPAVEKFVEEKPLEELTDEDIMKLSGEACRRYMLTQSMKGREVPRPAAINKITPLAKQPMMPFRPRQAEEKPANKRGASVMKNGVPESSPLSTQSGLAVQHDVAGPSSTSGSRNGFQVPRYHIQSQASLGEDSHGGARPSDRLPHMLESTLSLSFPTSREQPLPQSSPFGSPFLRMLSRPEHHQRPPHANQSGQGSGPQAGATTRSTGQSHLPGRPPTAQLTIFYSGMVNVYDDVPADKAQAIMLLAGSGSSWSSSIMNPPQSVPVRPPPTGGMTSSSNSQSLTVPVPAIAAMSQPGPATSPVIPTISVTGGLVAGRPTIHAELPQARKASLARFLEKRKDRARGKSPYMPPPFSAKKDIGSSTPPRENSPSPSNVKTRRSPSPVTAAPVMNAVSRNRSPSPAQRPGLSQQNGNETSSPTRQSAAAPQQAMQPNASEDQASTSTAQRPRKEDRMDWRSQQLPHVSSQEQNPEPMEEGTGSPSQRH